MRALPPLIFCENLSDYKETDTENKVNKSKNLEGIEEEETLILTHTQIDTNKTKTYTRNIKK